MSDTYTTIFGGHESLSVPGESAMSIGPVESHSIFGTDVTAADAEIATLAAPASGPVDMAPMPIQAGGPDANSVIPIDDRVTYGMSTFGGAVRDVAGLGGFGGLGSELMLEQTRHGVQLVQAAAGLGRYVPGRGDFGGLGASAFTTAAINAAQLSPTLMAAVAQQAAVDADAAKKKKMWIYGGVAVAALAVVAAVAYSRKSAA